MKRFSYCPISSTSKGYSDEETGEKIGPVGGKAAFWGGKGASEEMKKVKVLLVVVGRGGGGGGGGESE